MAAALSNAFAGPWANISTLPLPPCTKSWVTIEITSRAKTFVVHIDKGDEQVLRDYKWNLDCKGQIRAKVGGSKRSLSRFLMGEPAGLDVRHVNGDKLDNRRENLCVASRAENMRSKRNHNRLGIKGVTKVKGQRYQVRLRDANGKDTSHGTYATLEEAAKKSRDVLTARETTHFLTKVFDS